MGEVSLAELAREVARLAEQQKAADARNDRRFNDYVRKAEHDLVARNIEDDVGDIKDSQRWMARFLAANFLTLIVGLILMLLERAG